FLVFFTRLIEVLPPILRATHESFRGLVLAQFATSALAMLPTAVAFGFNFPAVALLIAGRQSTPGSEENAQTVAGELAGEGSSIGRAYAWNTLGAILGAIAAGFWLMPLLGSFHLIAVTVLLNLILAAILSVQSGKRSRKIARLAL